MFGGLLGLLYVIALAVLWPGLDLGRTWLWLPQRIPLERALLSTVGWAFAGYLIAIPFCLAIAWLMTRGTTSGEPGLFVAIFSLWMPLWWAVPIGAVLAWRRERQHQNRAKPE